MPKFYRIYWTKKFEWKKYAKLYDMYCKTKNNYYVLSAKALINSIKIRDSFSVVDLGCGTGALTETLLKKYPKIKKIIAIDVSKEALYFYKKNFAEQIKNKQIEVIQGNAETIHKYVNRRVDLIFIASSLWDMKLETLFKNLTKIMKRDTKIIANLPSLIEGKQEGFIYIIEKYFKKETGTKRRYRRISLLKLKRLLDNNNLSLVKKRSYEFILSKENVKKFFKVLLYRYPFIFFSEKTPYKEAYRKCKYVFNKILEEIPKEGIKEKGDVLIIKKKSI